MAWPFPGEAAGKGTGQERYGGAWPEGGDIWGLLDGLRARQSGLAWPGVWHSPQTGTIHNLACVAQFGTAQGLAQLRVWHRPGLA